MRGPRVRPAVVATRPVRPVRTREKGSKPEPTNRPIHHAIYRYWVTVTMEEGTLRPYFLSVTWTCSQAGAAVDEKERGKRGRDGGHILERLSVRVAVLG